MTVDVAPRPLVSQQRHAAVKGACEGWIRKLIDPSRRNNLLFFRDLKLGTFDLSHAPQDALAALLAQPAIPCRSTGSCRKATSRLLPRVCKRSSPARCRTVRSRGLETLFAALGMAAWTASDGVRPYAAPVLPCDWK